MIMFVPVLTLNFEVCYIRLPLKMMFRLLDFLLLKTVKYLRRFPTFVLQPLAFFILQSGNLIIHYFLEGQNEVGSGW